MSRMKVAHEDMIPTNLIVFRRLTVVTLARNPLA